MDNTVLFLGLGCLIGIVLFFVCEHLGLLYKWSGLKPPQPKNASRNQSADEEVV